MEHGASLRLRRELPPLSALPERFAGPAHHQGDGWAAGCSFGGPWVRVGRIMASLQWGYAKNLAIFKRLSVLLPERSNCCNQQLCAFGGLRVGGLSPDGRNSTRTCSVGVVFLVAAPLLHGAVQGQYLALELWAGGT